MDSIDSQIVVCPNPNCRQKLRIPAEKVDLRAICPSCKSEFSPQIQHAPRPHGSPGPVQYQHVRWKPSLRKLLRKDRPLTSREMGFATLAICSALALVWFTLPRHYSPGDYTTGGTRTQPNFLTAPELARNDIPDGRTPSAVIEEPMIPVAPRIISSSSTATVSPGSEVVSMEKGASSHTNQMISMAVPPKSGTILGGGT